MKFFENLKLTESLAQADTDVVQTSHKLRGRAVRQLLHFHQVGTQGRLALANRVFGKHAELAVGVDEVGGSEGGVGHVADGAICQRTPCPR